MTQLKILLEVTKNSKLLLVLLLALTTLLSTVQVLIPFTFGSLIGTISQDPSRVSLGFNILIFGSATLAALVLEQAFNFAERIAIPTIRREIQLNLFRRTLLNMPSFFELNSGATVGHAIKQGGRTGVLIVQNLTNEFPQIFIAYISSFILFIITGESLLGLFLFIWSIIFTFIAIFFAQKARPSVKRFSSASNKSGGEVSDILANYEAIRSSWSFKSEVNRFSSFLDEEHQANVTSRGYMIAMSMVHGIATWLLIILIIFYCFIWNDITVERVGPIASSITLAIVLSNMSKNFSRSILNFSEVWQTFSNSLITIGYNTGMKHNPNTAIRKLSSELHTASAGLDVNVIELKDVSFRYSENQEMILKRLSFEISKGEFVGIVGESGAGKSTILKLLSNVFAPTEGCIKINEQPMEEYEEEVIAKTIGYVGQIPKLFSRSIKDNVTYYNTDADLGNLREILEKSGCEFVYDRDHGLNFNVGQEGRLFSVGERQRMMIARLLFGNRNVLLLDEPTSALDPQSEHLVLQTISELRKAGHTVICVSHRLNLVVDADKIVVLDDGAISEVGTHRALLAREGIYSNFWHKQFRDCNG